MLCSNNKHKQEATEPFTLQLFHELHLGGGHVNTTNWCFFGTQTYLKQIFNAVGKTSSLQSESRPTPEKVEFESRQRPGPVCIKSKKE